MSIYSQESGSTLSRGKISGAQTVHYSDSCIIVRYLPYITGAIMLVMYRMGFLAGKIWKS